MKIATLCLLALLGGCAAPRPEPREIWVVVQGTQRVELPVRLGEPVRVVQVRVEPVATWR